MGRDHEAKKNVWSKRMKPGFIQTAPIHTTEILVVHNYFNGFFDDVGQQSADVGNGFYFVKLRPCLIS
jgi:hypothetical protein